MRIARRICLATVIAALLAIAGAGAWLWSSGYRAYVIHTGSMTPTYKPGSLVIDGPATGHYHPGEVITFRHSPYTTDVVTHRITEITPSHLIHTKGDANRTADVWNIRMSQVRGTVVTGIPFAGFVVVYLKQPAGIASVMTAVFALILLWGLWFAPETVFMTAAESFAPAESDAETTSSGRPSRLRRLVDWRPGGVRQEAATS